MNQSLLVETPADRPAQALDRLELRDLGKGDISLGNRLLQSALMAADHLVSRPLAARWVAGLRDKVQARIRQDLAKRPPGRMREIARVRDISPEEFYRDWVKPGIPLVMEGMAKDWPCSKKWSLEYFAETYGDDKVVVTEGTVQTVKNVAKEYVLLRDVIRNADPKALKYLRFHPMMAEHPELSDDFPIEWFERFQGKKSAYYQAQFFIGTQGTTTGVHNAQMANLFAMVRGEKHWQLWPTKYTAFMDPPTTRSMYRLSRHNSGQLVEPALSQLDGFSFLLKEGDVLWNPPFYWHSVHNLTDTIGVGYRYKNRTLGAKMSLTMYLLDYMAMDPGWISMYRMCRRENRASRIRRPLKGAG